MVTECPAPHAAAPRAAWPALAKLPGPVLVATDGTDDSMPAVQMARLLVASGAAIEVVAVVEPIILPPGQFGEVARSIDADREASVRQRVAHQVAEVLPSAAEPMIHTAIGAVGRTIAAVARTRHAPLVVTGLRRHGQVDRMLLRGDTPLRVARAARTPVFVVPAPMATLPRVVVIGTDGEEASIVAARCARPLLAHATSVHVVHVRSLAETASRGIVAPWAELLAAVEREHFDRLVAALDLPATVDVSTQTLTGHPVDELLDFTEYVRAELLVTGYRKRFLLNPLPGSRSIAERLYRGTPCAMLLVPEGSLWHEEHADTDRFARSDEWTVPLQRFSRRNADRSAALEIDDAALGAQVQVTHLPFRGITYERATRTLYLTFGRRVQTPMHLTHAIVEPESILIRRDADGRDAALRVGQGESYSLLTFVDG